jgi:hypothetical protein
MSEENEAGEVHIPFANNSLYPIRAEVDEESFIMLNEILSTRFTCVALNRQVKPGYMQLSGKSGSTSLLLLIRKSPPKLAKLVSGLASGTGKFLETQTPCVSKAHE